MSRRLPATRLVGRARVIAAVAVAALPSVLADCSGERTTPKAPAAKRPGSSRARSPGGGLAEAPVRVDAPGAHPAAHERVPVLMYHLVESAPVNAPLRGLFVPRSEFKGEVDWLAASGYHAVTLQQVWNAWHHGGLLPSKPIVVSFDDGYASQYTTAMPILRSHGWSGVLNLEVATLHTTLRRWQVRALIRAGWEVDAHTMTHPDLTRTYGARLSYEIAGSRRWIRSRFGVPVNFFCYPAGRFDAHVAAAVKAAGYLAATTTNAGLASPSQPRYELARVRVDGGEGSSGLERSLRAAVSAR